MEYDINKANRHKVLSVISLLFAVVGVFIALFIVMATTLPLLISASLEGSDVPGYLIALALLKDLLFCGVVLLLILPFVSYMKANKAFKQEDTETAAKAQAKTTRFLIFAAIALVAINLFAGAVIAAFAASFAQL